MVEIYTDGSCGKRHIGAWAYVMRFWGGGVEAVFSKSRAVEHTTNQRMEMEAVLRALQDTNPHANVLVCTDSAYVMNCFIDNWHVKWRRNGWITSTGKDVSNRDLWEPLIARVEQQRVHGNVEFVKVKGHSGDRLNELVDKLALKTREEYECRI